MPKVSDEYLEQKTNYILDCAEEVFSEKSVFDVTMRDIIRAAGMGQGSIYHYYACVSEIYVDLINRRTPKTDTAERMDSLFGLENVLEKSRTEAMFRLLGEHYAQLISKIGSKFYLELVLYSYMNRAEWKKYSADLVCQKETGEIIGRCINYLIGKMTADMPAEELMRYIGSSIDGIFIDIASQAAEQNSDDVSADMLKMFGFLGKIVADMLFKD